MRPNSVSSYSTRGGNVAQTVLHPDRAPPEPDGFHQDRADTAHRIEHQLAGRRVADNGWRTTSGSIFAGCAVEVGT
ncbi:hypothetical protein FHX82_005822 [Amycolatopsis bartoniae]|uniref:Uncharacterized protein n=1 Tax=Amycolatopsis bartoniae TaxID=941986 RepID=A0A8H9J0K4_9PSEU|nr:hypothetical protein [Amycolatopsis bartoniae]GHF79850.1 hypothetical protein GCM10017566_62580 [Amycolatopsis bartoniae]